MNLRTQAFLERVPNHPLAPAMKASIQAALAAGEAFVAKQAELSRSDKLTTSGQRQALRDALLHDHGKQLVRAKAPIAAARKEIQQRRAALKVAPADPENVAAMLERQEIRTYLRGLDMEARHMVAMTTTDPRILAAIVSAPPELAGLSGKLAHVAANVEARYLAVTNGPEIEAINALEAVVDIADAAAQVARNEMQTALGLNDSVFTQLMAPVEQQVGRAWLARSNNIDGKEVVVRIQPDKIGKPDMTRPATSEEIADGVFYANESEFKAAQGQAAA